MTGDLRGSLDASHLAELRTVAAERAIWLQGVRLIPVGENELRDDFACGRVDRGLAAAARYNIRA